MDPNTTLIIGLDIGTCLTKICYRRPGSAVTETITKWSNGSPSQCRMASPTAPSALYYPLGSTIPILEHKQIDDEPENYDARRLVKYWNSGLQPGSRTHTDIAAKAELLKINIDQFAFQMTTVTKPVVLR
ncbi:hypothetical protein SBOR_2245 [Sclerotinia borealis F-4128]|uniref:Uncharacterized protein n=1 Tax=Sclerotinia borealis (strain F-4128) TaxID=1432307 RepID=W9CNF4_SCLBF|nr:hypothetical protein SBOR_2245 [Sclerotinia borealis F-4128]